METPQKIVRIKRDIAYPLVCKNRDDFTKFFFSLAHIFADVHDDSEDSKEKLTFIIESMQMIMHEYLALVFSGDMLPYEMKFASEDDKKESLSAFRQGMVEITERLMKSGVPMQEKDGRYEIQFDELKKKGREEFWNE